MVRCEPGDAIRLSIAGTEKEKDKKKTNLLKNFKSESEATGGGRAVGPVAREVDGETLTQRNSVAVDAVIRTL